MKEFLFYLVDYTGKSSIFFEDLTALDAYSQSIEKDIDTLPYSLDICSKELIFACFGNTFLAAIFSPNFFSSMMKRS